MIEILSVLGLLSSIHNVKIYEFIKVDAEMKIYASKIQLYLRKQHIDRKGGIGMENYKERK